MNQSVLKNVFITLMLSCLVTACGWHLRGQVDVPVAYRILDLQANKASPLSQKMLRQSFLSNGITLSEDAPYILTITNEQSDRRTLAVTSNAKASEYELIETLSFKVVDSENQLESNDIDVTSYRTLQYDASAEIGKAQEEQNLRREMKQSNAYNILLRLKAVKLKPIQGQ